MNLDEAILHCLEVAKENEALANQFSKKNQNHPVERWDSCEKCAKQHRQLAKWLMDYKRLKDEREFLIQNEYCRGWHDALCKALKESYYIQCEDESFEVVQVETLKGLGMSMNCALGKGERNECFDK